MSEGISDKNLRDAAVQRGELTVEHDPYLPVSWWDLRVGQLFLSLRGWPLSLFTLFRQRADSRQWLIPILFVDYTPVKNMACQVDFILRPILIQKLHNETKIHSSSACNYGAPGRPPRVGSPHAGSSPLLAAVTPAASNCLWRGAVNHSRISTFRLYLERHMMRRLFSFSRVGKYHPTFFKREWLTNIICIVLHSQTSKYLKVKYGFA